VTTWRARPTPNHLDTIPGIGAVTAAVLTAVIPDIDRFDTPGKRVASFGVLPTEASSGIDREGQARAPRRYVRSRRGNDRVRRDLWLAARSAVRGNPAVRGLYARVVAKHPPQKAVAIGHAMRELLHLVFAIWKTRRPFDPKHYSWDQPAHVAGRATDTPGAPSTPAACPEPVEPARAEVAAAGAGPGADPSAPDAGLAIEFTHLKKQLPLARVLDHLGLSAHRKGTGSQRRCSCPSHRGDGRSRTFSANLDENVYQCFQASCGSKGDVIDRWAAVHGRSLRAAAIDLVRTFGLEPSPSTGTGKRNG
jgi:hypothetical protein